MLTMEGHQMAGSEIETFEWVSEPVEVRNTEVQVIYAPQEYTRIDDVSLIDADSDVVIDRVQIGNVILLAFVARHPVADPGRYVNVWLAPKTYTLMGTPPVKKATVRIRGVRTKTK